MSGKVKELQEAAEFMDCLSQKAFSEIELLAKLTLKFMEQPECYSRHGEIGDALHCILTKAQTAMNDINVAAEGVGCHFFDEQNQARSRARADALTKALEKGRVDA